MPHGYSQRAACARFGNEMTESSRILVLEPDEKLASEVTTALQKASPDATVDLARNLEEAQRMAMGTKPDLFVLDVDATYDLGQEFLYDLRTSHPTARAIILTAIHLAAARERAAGLGVGAIHFLEKPFPHDDFVDLVQALLKPSTAAESLKFQGTLSDLHIADIIQLKCMSGATAAIEFTGPRGEKARVYFENGQVRHATAPGMEGMAAFNEIMTWKGGQISEVASDTKARTIDLDWQVLLMEGIRSVDEAHARPRATPAIPTTKRKILVIDDSLMLLSFVKEILSEANYAVTIAATAAESLEAAKSDRPDLILLDYVLPDMRGNEVSRKLLEDRKTARIPVVYMSGFGTDLRKESEATPNVIGFLNKPFTSDLLIKTVESHMPKSLGKSSADEGESEALPAAEPEPAVAAESTSPPAEPQTAAEQETVTARRVEVEQPTAKSEEWWTAPHSQAAWPEPAPTTADVDQTAVAPSNGEANAAVEEVNLPDESVTGGAYFCGDTRFFSLNWALQTIAKEKLTGSLRSFWNKEPVELLAHEGRIGLVTTRDPELYCPEAPITLVNVDAQRIEAAKGQQRETGCPLFIALAQENLILREPAMQLVQHYGQKLFAQLWTAKRVRFVFEQNPPPPYAADIPTEADIDNWTLATLRSIQFQDLGNQGSYDATSIPAYTKDGFERVQNLRLTVAEAQFASQFNGVRSIQQIAKNLRLDIKFARLTLFRFLALEIVECWPPTAAAKPERKGVLQRLTRTIGIGE